MIRLEPNRVYLIELCSGEQRQWKYLGQSCEGKQSWWRDEESGVEFNEANLMYAWQILRQKGDQPELKEDENG